MIVQALAAYMKENGIKQSFLCKKNRPHSILHQFYTQRKKEVKH